MAYCVKKNTSPVTHLPYLPKQLTLPDGEIVVLDRANSADEPHIYTMYKHTIDVEGDSYPYYEVGGFDGFLQKYMSRDTFVVRTLLDEKGVDQECGDGNTKCSSNKDALIENNTRVMGSFYIKPNYPGRSGHICNGGFLVHPDFRRRGVGTLMAKAFLPLARDVGYMSAMFNLVYVINVASLRLWRKLGYREIGRIPKAGHLKGSDDLVDAIQFYYDLSEVPPEYELC